MELEVDPGRGGWTIEVGVRGRPPPTSMLWGGPTVPEVGPLDNSNMKFTQH